MVTLVTFATFDVLNTVPLYTEWFGTDKSEALNDNFDEAGYSSMQFVRNIGSLFIFILIGIGLGVSGLLILKIKKLPQKLRVIIKTKTDQLFLNGVFNFV